MEAGQTSTSQTRNIKKLYDAALEGDTNSFLDLLKEDPLILDRCFIEKSSACMQSPLHVASAKGHLPIIQTLVKEKPLMCYAYDQDGNTPIHVAVVNGHIEALKVFLQRQPLAVREPTTRGETVLHMCVKFNQPNVLRSLLGITLEDDSLLNSPDSNGNTVLPPAMAAQDTQMREIPPTNPETGNVMNEQRLNNNGGDSLARIFAMNRSLCLVRDQNGRSPIHVAAAIGHIEVLRVLHRANRDAAQERTNNGESILHLCVKHSQFEALKTLLKLTDDDGDQLINSKDNNGNTILHLAVSSKQHKMVKYLLEKCKSSIEINAVNNKDLTVVDLYKKLSKNSKKDLGDRKIEKYLKCAKAKPAKDTLDHEAKRLENQRSALMVVASLIATMAFQVGINPPGGVWQEFKKDNPRIIPGTAIWSYFDDNYYNIVMVSNTIGFVSSISVILLLISGLPFKRTFFITILRVTLWISVAATSVTYYGAVAGWSSVLIEQDINNANAPSKTAILAIMTWLLVMGIVCFGNVLLFLIKMIGWQRRESIARCCSSAVSDIFRALSEN